MRLGDRHLADELPRAGPPGRGGDARLRSPRSASAGARTLIGAYRPTAKNAMVAEHYAKLRFTKRGETEQGHIWELDLAECRFAELPFAVERRTAAKPASATA